MSRIYDNWEKLVKVVMRREKDRQLAHAESFSTSYSTDFSSEIQFSEDLKGTIVFNETKIFSELNELAEQRRAEIARLRELNTLKGHVESLILLKGLDIETTKQGYTI